MKIYFVSIKIIKSVIKCHMQDKLLGVYVPSGVF